jgi:hypothetical protein
MRVNFKNKYNANKEKKVSLISLPSWLNFTSRRNVRGKTVTSREGKYRREEKEKRKERKRNQGMHGSSLLPDIGNWRTM